MRTAEELSSSRRRFDMLQRAGSARDPHRRAPEYTRHAGATRSSSAVEGVHSRYLVAVVASGSGVKTRNVSMGACADDVLV